MRVGVPQSCPDAYEPADTFDDVTAYQYAYDDAIAYHDRN